MTSFLQCFRTWINLLGRWIFPPSCLVCEAVLCEYLLICPACWEKLPRTRQETIHSLWLARTQSETVFLDNFLACFLFTEEVQKLIHSLKYQRFTGIANEMIDKVFPEIQRNPVVSCCDLIVPVPLHPRKEKKRGFNQSGLLAKAIGRRCNVPVQQDGLLRTRNTRSQTTLNAEERQRNVSNAFKVKDPATVQGKKILIVDDLITTGATMNECARVLKEAGAGEVNGFSLARPQ